MNIQGIRKLTLLDYPGRMACTVFTAGCNFRCPFCHNAPLVTKIDLAEQIPTDQVLAFLSQRRNLLDGVCITGGEPLLQAALEVFLYQVKDMGYQVKLDTNGSNVYRLRELVEQELVDYVAMDIKNAPYKYAETIGLESFDMDSVFRSVEYLMEGNIPYEFRTTVVREFHKRDDFAEIGRWLKGAGRYYLQSFVDSGDVLCPGLRGYSKEIMEQALAVVREYIPNAALRGVEQERK